MDRIHDSLFDLAQGLGLLPLVQKVSRLIRGEVRAWVRAGRPPPPPHIVKIETILTYIRSSHAEVFVETGTYRGITLDHVARTPGLLCYSIEIESALFERACRLLGRRGNITLLHGDSAAALPRLLEELDRPALFWLDGHHCAGAGRGKTDPPIREELAAILAHPVAHIILIDDARCFDGTNNYPTLVQLLETVADHPVYDAAVENDIVRIVPHRSAA